MMLAENEPVMATNKSVQNNLPGELYTIEVDDKKIDNTRGQQFKLVTIKSKQTLGFSKAA